MDKCSWRVASVVCEEVSILSMCVSWSFFNDHLCFILVRYDVSFIHSFMLGGGCILNLINVYYPGQSVVCRTDCLVTHNLLISVDSYKDYVLLVPGIRYGTW